MLTIFGTKETAIHLTDVFLAPNSGTFIFSAWTDSLTCFGSAYAVSPPAPFDGDDVSS